MKSEPATLDRSTGTAKTPPVDEIASLSQEILDRYEEVSLVYRLSERLGAVLGRRARGRVAANRREAGVEEGALHAQLVLAVDARPRAAGSLHREVRAELRAGDACAVRPTGAFQLKICESRGKGGHFFRQLTNPTFFSFQFLRTMH